MGTPVIQTSFNSGEWAPALNARVDLSKYKSGAALLRNFFVDYRGGATTRPGSKYIIQTKSTDTVRLIPFQASFAVSYVLEFGAGYIRFINNGAPVLETGKTLTAITQANPGVFTSAAHGFAVGDWVYLSGIVGMTELNGNYYIVGSVPTTATFTLTDLFGVVVNTTTFGVYTSGGTVQRIYTLTSPYQASELAAIKFAQNVADLILCHPNYSPYKLTLITAANWTLGPIVFGPTINPPTSGLTFNTTLSAGSVSYAYVVTAIDAQGQESSSSAYIAANSLQDIRSVAGTNTIGWGAVTGAIGYNVYRADPRYGSAVPVGASFGFIGTVTSTQIFDSNIIPDFSITAPILQNPFTGTGITSVTINTPGTLFASQNIPSVSFSGGGGAGAIGYVTAQCTVATIGYRGLGYTGGELVYYPNGVIIQVLTTNGVGAINDYYILVRGTLNTGQGIPGAPTSQIGSQYGGYGAQMSLQYGVIAVIVTNAGAGYSSPPSVVFSLGTATATAVIGTSTAGNPTVAQFFQQRLVFAGQTTNPQQFNISQPGAYYNYNISAPTQPTDAITGNLVSGQLNTIQAMVSQPQGLIILSDKQAWLMNGGSAGSAISAVQIVANSQAYNGCNAVPPIVANDHILYVQSKGSVVRDLVFNFYTQVYTGTDISVLSSHLFNGYSILEWAWAEEPYKLCWAVRNDGTMLMLTFLKEQELIAWTHSDTDGSYKSIATITETVQSGTVDAVYTVVQRLINGVAYQYIERMSEINQFHAAEDSFCVDAGLVYSGTAATTFRGAQHLAGKTVTGLADGLVIDPFVMPASGTFTLSIAATKVSIGLPFTAQLQTLEIDLGEPTVQGKMKKISGVTVRVKDTLGLQIGQTFDADSLVDMEDLVLGNIGKDTNALVTDLVTGDALQVIDPDWNVPGQFCIQQSLPLPASILGVIPQITVGDSKG